MTVILIVMAWLLLTFLGPAWLYLTGRVDLHADWRTANRSSARLAPDPKFARQAVIQVYAARAFNWRGLFASHCWIAVKPQDAESYTVYQVVGWLGYRGLPVLSIAQDVPDRRWYGAQPRVICDIQGEKAQALIPRVDEAARWYPYANKYVLWPGPNSNTFPAHVARCVPQLRLVLPADALGKDYISDRTFFARAPSGTGYQLSLGGLFGVLVALKEGIEINLLGMPYGIRFYPFRILLPGRE